MALPTTHRRLTASEYFTLPEGPPYFQVLQGELFISPSPQRLHQRISMRLSGLLFEHLRHHPTGEVYGAPSDVQLGPEDVYQPDLYYVSHERSAILNDQGADGAPDLVIEILSPSTARLDLERKREVYLRAGVRELWFVYPREGRILIDEFHDEKVPTVRSVIQGEILTTPLLPSLALETAAIFAA